MAFLSSVFAALICVGTFVRIPMVPVPITLQTLFVFLSALLLNPISAVSSVALWIVIGLLGLSVFTSGGGPAALLGPTGGFIFGCLLASLVGSVLVRKSKGGVVSNIIICLIMEVAVYVVGIPWLKVKLSSTWGEAFAAGLLPFIVGDALKIAAASFAAVPLKKKVNELAEKIRERRGEGDLDR